MFKLRTNGLPEGVMLPPRRYRRAIPDRWLGALPALARPDARRQLVIGLGARVSAPTEDQGPAAAAANRASLHDAPWRDGSQISRSAKFS